MSSILLIEDDVTFRESLALVLTENGHDVVQANDGREGLRLFQKAPTDLVVTDVVMPNKEGLETVLELRRARPQLGIIVISGGSRQDASLYLKLAASFGASRTLQKPFDPATFNRAVEEVLKASPKNASPD